MKKKKDLPYCPITVTLHVIGSKWKILILQKLELRPWRFNELARELDGISKMVLSTTLHSMEDDGIVEKTVCGESSFYTGYTLNSLGRSLIPLLKEIEKWGLYYREHFKKIATTCESGQEGQNL